MRDVYVLYDPRADLMLEWLWMTRAGAMRLNGLPGDCSIWVLAASLPEV